MFAHAVELRAVMVFKMRDNDTFMEKVHALKELYYQAGKEFDVSCPTQEVYDALIQFLHESKEFYGVAAAKRPYEALKRKFDASRSIEHIPSLEAIRKNYTLTKNENKPSTIYIKGKVWPSAPMVHAAYMTCRSKVKDASGTTNEEFFTNALVTP